MWQPAFTSNPLRENKPVHFLSRVTSCMWPLSHWMICWANQMQVVTWTLDAYDFAKLNKTADHHGLPFDFSGTQSSSTPPPPPYRCLTLFAGFRLFKIQKVFLILTAVRRTAVNYCFHSKSIDSCHGDMALKGWDFYWEENHSKLTLLYACGLLHFFVWLFQSDYSLHVIYLQLVLTHSILVQHLSLEVHVKCLALLSGG